MQKIRLLSITALLVLVIVVAGQTDIISWVDDQGVRHFSNTDAPSEDTRVEKQTEYKADPSNDKSSQTGRDSFKVLRMYQEENQQYREKKKQQEAKWAKEKAEKEEKERRKEDCAAARKKLEELKKSGWKNFEVPNIESRISPPRTWSDGSGNIYSNEPQRIAERNRIRIAAYERALQTQERYVEKACSLAKP